MKFLSPTILLLATALTSVVHAWDSDDHEIFRLRDELEKHEGPGINFYDFLEVTRSAKHNDIERALRRRSKAVHPDKVRQSFMAARAAGNKPASEREIKAAEKLASDRFTRLGLIAEILKDDRRRSYDHFLDNGFPKWRGTGYYYSRFRPGLTSTLLGLFVFAGGLLHYVVLVLGYKQQRDFVERYIRQARQAAWGNGGSAAVTAAGLSDAVLGNGAAAAAEEEQTLVEAVNRRDRRAQEKEAKRKNKDKSLKPGRAASTANGRSGTATPLEEAGGGVSGTSTPVPGARKRVEAENGKILVVDRAGNVFLEEEDEETEETSLLLLDPNEIEKPTFRQTFLVRLPVWAYGLAREKVAGAAGIAAAAEESLNVDGAGDELEPVNGAAVAADEKSGGERQSTTKARKRKGKK